MARGYYERIRSVNENLRSLGAGLQVLKTCYNCARWRRLILLCDQVPGFGLDVDCIKAGSIPSASQGFHEENRGDQALPLNDGSFLLIA